MFLDLGKVYIKSSVFEREREREYSVEHRVYTCVTQSEVVFSDHRVRAW